MVLFLLLRSLIQTMEAPESFFLILLCERFWQGVSPTRLRKIPPHFSFPSFSHDFLSVQSGDNFGDTRKFLPFSFSTPPKPKYTRDASFSLLKLPLPSASSALRECCTDPPKHRPHGVVEPVFFLIRLLRPHYVPSPPLFLPLLSPTFPT